MVPVTSVAEPPGNALQVTRPLDRSYQDAGLWEGRAIGSLLGDQRTLNPDVTALVDDDVRLTYRELDDRVARVAAGLALLGVGPGRSVLVQLPNWWEAIVVYHAVARLGGVINPVVPIYRQAELSFIVAQSAPAVIVTPRRFRGTDYVDLFADVLSAYDGERPSQIVVRSDADPASGLMFETLLGAVGPIPDSVQTADDLALLLYTSGTTAAPKGVLHSSQTLVYECRSVIGLAGLGSGDPIFMASPITHITGFLYGFITPALAGSAAVLLDVWEPSRAVDLIEREQCRLTVAATPFLTDMVDEYGRRGTSSALRVFGCGGADVPPALIRAASDIFHDGLSRVYGSSEFPTYSWGPPGSALDARADTDGAPIGPADGVLADEVDGVGELLVRGPELFHGYLDERLNVAAFTDDGFFRTGDLASFDDDGNVIIRGRKKDIIIRKGENISAREVEDHLFEHPDIDDVAVVALPDESSGERGCAVVVSSNAALTLADLQRHLKARGIAVQKWPEQLELVDGLPRTASGKVQKFLLRERLGGLTT